MYSIFIWILNVWLECHFLLCSHTVMYITFNTHTHAHTHAHPHTHTHTHYTHQHAYTTKGPQWKSRPWAFLCHPLDLMYICTLTFCTCVNKEFQSINQSIKCMISVWISVCVCVCACMHVCVCMCVCMYVSSNVLTSQLSAGITFTSPQTLPSISVYRCMIAGWCHHTVSESIIVPSDRMSDLIWTHDTNNSCTCVGTAKCRLVSLPSIESCWRPRGDCSIKYLLDD